MTEGPVRVARSRGKGWRKPAGAVYVGRPTAWGNLFGTGGEAAPFFAASVGLDARKPYNRRWAAAMLYVHWLSGTLGQAPGFIQAAIRSEIGRAAPAPPTVPIIQQALGGKTLVCWCPTDNPCHGDILLHLANKDIPPPAWMADMGERIKAAAKQSE